MATATGGVHAAPKTLPTEYDNLSTKLSHQSEYSQRVEKMLRIYFWHNARLQEKLRTFVRDFEQIEDKAFHQGKAELYGSHQQQLDDLFNSLNDSSIDLCFKELAISRLPSLSQRQEFLLMGCYQALTILKCKDFEKAQLLTVIWQISDSGDEELYEEIVAKITPKVQKTYQDWYILTDEDIPSLQEAQAETKKVPREAFQDWCFVTNQCILSFEEYQQTQKEVLQVIQGRKDPLYVAKQYIHDLSCRLVSSTEEDLNKLSDELKLVIGDEAYTALMQTMFGCEGHDVSVSMLVQLIDSEELPFLIAANLYPVAKQLIPTKDKVLCWLTAEYKVVVDDRKGGERVGNWSDLLNVDLPQLHPHIRGEFINSVCQRVTNKGDLARFFLMYKLDSECFDYSEYYKYDLKAAAQPLFKQEVEGETFKSWLSIATKDEVKRIFPFLRLPSEIQAWFTRVRASAIPLHYTTKWLHPGCVISLGKDYLSKFCPPKVQMKTLNKLCALLPDAKEEKATIKEAIKVILSIESRDNTQHLTYAISEVAKVGNTVALELLLEQPKEKLSQLAAPEFLCQILAEAKYESLRLLCLHWFKPAQESAPASIVFWWDFMRQYPDLKKLFTQQTAYHEKFLKTN